MDNEDFGRNNPPFQRYIPPCYRNHQKYIPSLYLTEKDGLPDKDTPPLFTAQVTDDKRYSLKKGKWIPQVKASARKKERTIS